jgi:P27 family predicted phage terminase small subunit
MRSMRQTAPNAHPMNMKRNQMSRRKSIEDHKLSGTYRADRHNKTTLAFPSGATAPRYLSKAAKAEWKRVAPLLEEAGILQAIDQTLLASYCQMFAHYRASEDDIAKNGLVIIVTSQTRTGSTSKPVQNPAVRNSIQFHRAMVGTAVKFGINPLDRPRITVPPNDSDVVEEDESYLDYLGLDGVLPPA